MNVRYLTNLVLFLLVISLYWLINQPEENNTHQLTTLSTLKANQVTNIVIQRTGRDEIHLVKDNTRWKITQPIQAKANKTRINLILDLLSLPPVTQFNPADISLKQFGLNPAKINLQLNQQQFQFGDIEAISKNRYIKHNGIIYLINDRLVPLLNSTASSFIDNRLIDSDLHISQLQLPNLEKNSSHTMRPIITIKMVNGHWQSNKKTVSADTLTALIEAWQHAYALQVIPLSTEIISSLTGEKIIVSFQQDVIPTEFLLQLGKHSLSLINLKEKMKYQFPLTIKQQLFPIETTN